MNKQQLQSLLISAGLNKKEVKVYLYLLENGISKASDVIGVLKIKKGNTYALLNSLCKKGFALKKGVKFVPQPPEAISQQIKEKIKNLNSNLSHLDSLLPELNSLYKLSVGKPTIKYFEGEEGIKKVFDDIYGKKKEVIYGCVDLEKADEALPEYIVKNLIPKRIRNKVGVVSLVADSKQAKELAKKDKQQLRKTKLVDKDKYPLPAEIDVYEDKIAMLTFSRGEFIGLLIENRDLAQSLKSVFKLAFGN